MIQLNNNFRIDSDGTQYILRRSKTAVKQETKEEYETLETIGYYGELSQSLKAYCRKVMLDYTKCEAVSLYQVLDKLEELEKEIKAYE